MQNTQEYYSNSEDTKLRQIINDQSQQMLSLVDISNTYSNENDKLKEVLKKYIENKLRLEELNSKLKQSYYVQIVLIILILILLFYNFNKI